jgi:hypothetical protein
MPTTRRKELRFSHIGIQDGFSGTGAVNESGLAAAATDMDIDTLVLVDSLTIVPTGARFTTAGITTVRTVTAQNNSQVWNLTNGGASAGTFDLTLNGELAAGIAYNATIAAVQTALDALASITAGVDVVVGGTDAGPWTITMGGDNANLATNTLVYDGSGLTGGPGVLSVLQDGTTTWNITFTPALIASGLPIDDDVITWLPQRILARVDDGADFSYTESYDPQIDTERGLLSNAREGTEQPMSVSTAFVFDWMRASTGGDITFYEALNQLGDASDWVTAASDPCEPFSVDLFLFDRPECVGEEAEVFFFREFYKQSISPSLNSASVSLEGICKAVRPEIQRVTNDDDTIDALV